MKRIVQKRILAFCICLIMAANILFPLEIKAVTMAGYGTADNPYLIYTLEDFYEIQDNPDAYYKLMNDLDMAYQDYTPIFMETPFTGTFDGNNFTIANIMIFMEDSFLALFGQTESAVIKNLCIENVELTNLGRNTSNSAALIGFANDTVVENCTVKNASLSGSHNTGALIGQQLGGQVLNCQIDSIAVSGLSTVGGVIGYQDIGAIVDGLTLSDVWLSSINGVVGGVVGLSRDSSISNVTVNDLLTNNNIQYIGGIVGNASGATITNAAVSGLSLKGANYTGGIVGAADSTTVTNASVSGTAIDGNNYVGGIVGYTHNPLFSTETYNITQSLADIDIYGGEYVGGIAGQFSANYNIEESYFTGNITGTNTVGGLVGLIMYDFENSFSIHNCFALGTATAYKGTAGGIYGNSYDNTTSITNSYAAMRLLGNTTYGLGNGTATIHNSWFDASITEVADTSYGKPTVALTEENNFTGWDFNSIWTIDEGVSYPYLKNLDKPFNGFIIAPLIPVTSVTVTPARLELPMGETADLHTDVTPADASNQNVFYISMNPDIAVVDRETGAVTGIFYGSTVIYAVAHNGFTAMCMVTVTDEIFPDSVISLE